MTAVAVHAEGQDEALAAAAREALVRALAALGVGVDVELALVLTDDETLRSLNDQFRGIDAPTDVLSFPPGPMPGPPASPRYLGDIIVSVPYAGRSAAAAGHGLTSEVLLLAVHGLLHLLGHEDESDDGAAAMRALEHELGLRSDE